MNNEKAINVIVAIFIIGGVVMLIDAFIPSSAVPTGSGGFYHGQAVEDAAPALTDAATDAGIANADSSTCIEDEGLVCEVTISCIQ